MNEDRNSSPASSANMTPGPLNIDLHAILRSRIKGWKGKLIPGFLISALERLICQDGLNDLLRKCYPLRGSAFCTKVLRELDITVELHGLENIPESGRFVFASNHPLGGLDGITLISVLAGKYGDNNIRFMVNDMLMNVEPLTDVFLPVNKYGAQGRRAARDITHAYESDMQIVQFPAGLVSRLHDDGTISDLEWQKAFVTKAIESGRDIIPLRFEALNTPSFYRIARWRKKSGLKVNIEQALLPSQVFKAKGKRFRIFFGKPVDRSMLLEAHTSPKAKAAHIRELVYSL